MISVDPRVPVKSALASHKIERGNSWHGKWEGFFISKCRFSSDIYITLDSKGIRFIRKP